MSNAFRETLEEPVFGVPYAAGDRAESSRIAAKRGVLLLALALGAGLLYWLATAILSGRSMAFDTSVLFQLHQYQSAKLAHIANLVCMLVTCTSVFILAYWCWRRQWAKALFWFASTAGASLLCGIGKKVMERHRPELWALASKHATFSFPSGHATQSMAILVALLLLAPPEKRKTIFALGLPCIALVGLCRLYLGLHYPTDIAAGWALALSWCSLLGLLCLPRATSR
jgi:membrane-associated phospholipid phosphatase